MKILNKHQIRNIEQSAAAVGFSEIRMMENAGAAATSVITEKFEVEGKHIAVLAGSGNNGGDGFVVARKLYDAGAQVTLILVSDMPKTPTARETLSKLTLLPVRVYNGFDRETAKIIDAADIIVDAIFGIGFHGEVDEYTRSVIEYANRAGGTRVSIDIPSGCECDTGSIGGICFDADITVTFIAVKPCHVLYPASDYCGKLIRVGIGLPPSAINLAESDITVIDFDTVKAMLPKRRKNDHKGTCGTALTLCGSYSMAGASILSLRAALKSGVGLVNAALPDSIYPIVAASVPEAVFTVLSGSNNDTFDVLSALKKADAALIGCGIGVSAHTRTLVAELLPRLEVPAVIDADGINIVSENIDILSKCKVPLILTPHPAEMSRLTGIPVKDVQNNRLRVAKAAADKWGKIVVLKGANTIVALPGGGSYVCMNGNPGMATGGSGDTLSGIMVSLLAEGLSPENAAIAGVFIHALAGDNAASRLSLHSMLPSDIIDSLPYVFKQLEE